MPFWSRRTLPQLAVILRCSFCGKSQRDVKKLIAGPSVYICDECVALSGDIIAEEQKPVEAEPKPVPPAAPDPEILASRLAQSVFGQAVAVRAVAAAICHHLAVSARPERRVSPRVLLVGPRGCGKSTLVAAACSAVPGLASYHADAGRITETGYVGDDVENLIGGLMARGDGGDRGLLGLDGLHHLVRRTADQNRSSRDVAGREAQRDLVRLLDGMELAAVRQGPAHPYGARDLVRADRLMVLATATFDVSGLGEDAVRKALVEEGLVDETLSRFDVLVRMPALARVDLARVVAARFESVVAELEPLSPKLRLSDDGLAALVDHALASADGAFAFGPVWGRLREEVWMGLRNRTLDAALVSEWLRGR